MSGRPGEATTDGQQGTLPFTREYRAGLQLPSSPIHDVLCFTRITVYTLRTKRRRSTTFFPTPASTTQQDFSVTTLGAAAAALYTPHGEAFDSCRNLAHWVVGWHRDACNPFCRALGGKPSFFVSYGALDTDVVETCRSNCFLNPCNVVAQLVTSQPVTVDATVTFFLNSDVLGPSRITRK